MTLIFDQCALLSRLEARLLDMPDGQRHPVSMTRAGWTSFDDLATNEYFDAETLIEYAQYCRGDDTTKEFGEWLEHALMRVQERQRRDEQLLAEFYQFCASQPQTKYGMRRIEEAAQRLRDARTARYSEG
jgi:hypothetical protein